MPYNLSEHRHRFSVWAAARAAQRGFTTIDNLRDALELTDIRTFLEGRVAEPISSEQFMDGLTEAGVQNVSFGRAAKLVAVYLKSMGSLQERDFLAR